MSDNVLDFSIDFKRNENLDDNRTRVLCMQSLIIRQVAIFCVLSIAASGCVADQDRSDASLHSSRRGGKIGGTIEISRVTNKWHLSAHGSFGRWVEGYRFAIPRWPTEKIEFGAEEITVLEVRSLTKDVPPVIAGKLVVDPVGKEVVISLQTSKGEFPANGRYPLTYVRYIHKLYPIQ